MFHILTRKRKIVSQLPKLKKIIIVIANINANCHKHVSIKTET